MFRAIAFVLAFATPAACDAHPAPPLPKETGPPEIRWVGVWMRWPQTTVWSHLSQVGEGVDAAVCPVDMELFAHFYPEVFFIADYTHKHARWCEDVAPLMKHVTGFDEYKRSVSRASLCWGTLAIAFSYLADMNDGQSAQFQLNELRLLLGEDNYRAGIMPAVFYYEEK